MTAEQKVVIKNLYKYGRRIEHLNSHIEYLSQSLELNLIPSNWPPLMHALDLVNLKRQLLRINTHSCTLTSSPITKTGIIYGQALRILERCSEKEDADQHLENLRGKLTARNYPPKVIDKQFERALGKDRKSLIQQIHCL